jgi:predicted TIM-barrel fold metal-dependent hydrolase
MDRAGIDIQVLSAAAAARYANDEYGAVVSSHPDRFRALTATPMPDIDAAISEIGYAIDELGMVGVTMITALPMIPRRADDYVPWEAPDTPEPPSQPVHRLWYDTVSHCHAPALRCAIDSFGADHILLGTDFPYEDGDTLVRVVEYIIDATDPAEAHAILDANAMALFKLA